MVALNENFAPGNPALGSKNRVGIFFWPRGEIAPGQSRPISSELSKRVGKTASAVTKPRRVCSFTGQITVITAFLYNLILGLILASMLSFFIPTGFFLKRRSRARFPKTVVIASVAMFLFLLNSFYVIVDYNRSFLPFGDLDSNFIRLGFYIGFVGFLILFGSDIKQWKDDP